MKEIFLGEARFLLHLGCSCINILDSIAINLDEEDTLDDDEHEIIDLDVDFLTQFL